MVEHFWKTRHSHMKEITLLSSKKLGLAEVLVVDASKKKQKKTPTWT